MTAKKAASSLLLWMSLVWGASAATIEETTTALLQVCMGASSYEKLEASGKGDIALTLKKLRNIGLDTSVASTFTREQWVGLIGGISAGLTAIQAEQADKVRDCLKPNMDAIVRMILLAR
jgi:hypothetical protein